VFKEHVSPDTVRDIVAAFDAGTVAQAGDDVPSAQLADLVDRLPGLGAVVASLAGGETAPSVTASAVEFVLEGLHLSKRLNKDSSSTYRARG
jgi:magnesium chelatase subunit I